MFCFRSFVSVFSFVSTPSAPPYRGENRILGGKYTLFIYTLYQICQKKSIFNISYLQPYDEMGEKEENGFSAAEVCKRSATYLPNLEEKTEKTQEPMSLLYFVAQNIYFKLANIYLVIGNIYFAARNIE